MAPQDNTSGTVLPGSIETGNRLIVGIQHLQLLIDGGPTLSGCKVRLDRTQQEPGAFFQQKSITVAPMRIWLVFLNVAIEIRYGFGK